MILLNDGASSETLRRHLLFGTGAQFRAWTVGVTLKGSLYHDEPRHDGEVANEAHSPQPSFINPVLEV